MTENLVQWVLLRRTKYLAERLNLSLKQKVAEYQTTDFGVIDFAFDTTEGELAVVELETAITSAAKLDFCIEQSTRYKQLSTIVAQPLRVYVLFDEAGTSRGFADRLKHACDDSDLELRSYSMPEIQRLYQSCMEELERTSGIYLGRPVAMNVTHLRLLNRLLVPFHERKVTILPFSDVLNSFTRGESKTAFTVRRILAEHFDLIREPTHGTPQRHIQLTELGEAFCENMAFSLLNRGHEFSLTHGQRQVLIQSLMNGHFTKSKVNIFYLLRFIHLTNGDWIPKSDREISPERLAYLNNFLGTNYRRDSLTRLVHFTLNECIELGLAEKIQTPRSDPNLRAMLTSLGSRVLGFLELYLHLKREQFQIPFQTVELIENYA